MDMNTLDEHFALYEEYINEVRDADEAGFLRGCTCGYRTACMRNAWHEGAVEYFVEDDIDSDCPLHGETDG